MASRGYWGQGVEQAHPDVRQLEVAPEHEVAVPALLAAYLLIRKAEEVASSVAATTVVAP